jgi:bifunctional oligoribonuclease and PAP phosphatase NrnA
MKHKHSFEAIINEINSAGKILLYTHVLMDGDTLGSAVALCKVFRNMGKTAYILIEDPIPEYLAFMEKGYCTYDCDIIAEPDLSIAVDCTDIQRFVKRKEKFLQAKSKICIDHHHTSAYFADLNYVDEYTASTGELIFKLLKQMGALIDQEIAEAIYVAITTDTGNFQYTNTTSESHRIAAELFEIGIDLGKISVELYQNVRPEKLKLTGEILKTIEMHCENKVALASVTQKVLQETDSSLEESEGIVETLRSIRGVEVSIFVKEISNIETKVGMRAKSYANVAEMMQKFGGGGHIKAAGCTIHAPVSEAKALIVEEVERYFNEWDNQHS